MTDAPNIAIRCDNNPEPVGSGCSWLWLSRAAPLIGAGPPVARTVQWCMYIIANRWKEWE